jgi:hypothetical protein
VVLEKAVVKQQRKSEFIPKGNDDVGEGGLENT